MMFEKAARMKLRFQYKGTISVEDLWDLQLEELDGIYGKLNAKVKSSQEDTLIRRKRTDETLELQIGILKHIAEVRMNEEEAAEIEAEKRAQKKFLRGILAEKKEADLRGKSVAEIEAMINEL